VALETGSRQRWSASIGEGPPDGAAVPSYALGLGIGASRHGPFQGAHATDGFFEDFLGMTVGLIEGLGRFGQGGKVTQVVGHLGSGMGDSRADGQWPIGQAPPNGHCKSLRDLADKRG
jgi:hypothetical protein